MASTRFSGFQRFVFAGDELGRLDFLALVAPQIHHAQPVLLTLQQVVELGRSARATVRRPRRHRSVEMPAKRSSRIRCWAWSKLDSVSVCACTSASSGASWRSTATVAGWLFTKTRPLPVERISRRRMISLPSASMPFSSRIASAPGVDSKTQATTAFSAPCRTTSARRLAAHQQRQRIDKNGLARAGFARQQVQPRAKDGNGVIDDGVVFGA